MTQLVTDTTYRHCSRCLKELTDCASREAGVGPVCRGKNNHLYAKTIEANVPIAGALILGTHPEEFHPELYERFNKFKTSFLKKSEKLQNTNDLMVMKLTGADFRDEIRELDYFLSYSMKSELRNRLIKVVEAFGYIGLAGVLSGEASNSKAKVWFENGRVWLSGTACKPGFYQMRKIPGINTPRFRGDQTPYSAPASEAETFLKIVQKFWPLYEADLNQINEQVKNWKEQNLEQTLEIEQPETNQTVLTPMVRTTARFRLRTEDFTLSFPWKKGENMYGLINKLKEVPYSDRKYDPNNRTWSFKLKHLDCVKDCVVKFFEDFEEEKTDKETPAGLYKSAKRNRKTSNRPRRRF